MPQNPIKEELRRLSPALSVGILPADLANLRSEVEMLERVGARLVHFDVMDGCFCPTMTIGPPLIKAVRTSLIKDVHLMISEPLEKVKDYAAAGADIITVHYESCRHIHRVLQTMGSMANTNDASRGLVRGLALSPGTPVEAIEALLDEVDLILLLAVNPGWTGQYFLASTIKRIARVKQMISGANKEILLGVDGGITRNNAAEIGKTGADVVVAGSAIFDGKASEANARYMLQALRHQAG